MKLINWLSQWTIVNKEIVKDKNEEIDRLEQINQNNSITYLEELGDYKRTNEKLTKEIQRLKHFKLPKPKTIYYRAPKKKKVNYYVRETNSAKVNEIADILISNNINNNNNVDSIVLECARWLNRQFRNNTYNYKHDRGETWEQPETTLKQKFGDCDNWGIVLYSVIRTVFKKLNLWQQVKDRLFCAVGGVNKRGSTPDPAEVHFYLVWRSPKDDEFYTVETTYYRGTAIVNFLKKPHRIDTMRNYMRYIFNENNAYKVHAFRTLKR